MKVLIQSHKPLQRAIPAGHHMLVHVPISLGSDALFHRTQVPRAERAPRLLLLGITRLCSGSYLVCGIDEPIWGAVFT